MSVSPFDRRPAVKLVLLLSVGILLAGYPEIDAVTFFLLSGGLFLLAIVFLLFPSRPSVQEVILSLLVITLGASLQSFQRDDFSSKKLVPIEENEVVAFEGILVEDPSVRVNRVQCVVQLKTLSRVGVVQKVVRQVVMYGRPKLLGHLVHDLEMGSMVRGQAVLDDYPQQRNPGEFDYGRYLELNGIHGVIAVKDSAAINVTASDGVKLWWVFPRKLRASLLQIVDSMHSEQAAGFLRGILLADRSKIPAEVKQSFVETGTVHVLAVSGLHVGVVALIFYGLFGLLRLSRRLIVAATITGLLSYMFLVGAPPSVVRATIMAVAILVGLSIERKVDVYQSLGVAALILLVWDSNNLFNVGFQLSFAAVVSIVYLYPIFANIIKQLPSVFQSVTILRAGCQLFAVSLAAQIGTLPFTAYYFDKVSIVSLIANVFVVPVVGLNVTLGFTTLLFSPISIWLAQSYAVVNDYLVVGLLAVVHYASEVPYASLNTARVEAFFPFVYYAGVFGIVNIRNRNVIKFLLVSGLCFSNVAVYSSLLRAEEATLRVTFLDVWQGDAILIEFPSGISVLLDAGGRTDTFDSGKRTIAPFLRYKGIDELEALIMSHPHSDHIGGVPYLLENFAVKQLVEPTVRGESATYQEIHRKAAESSIPVFKHGAGERIDVDPAARLYVLHPYFPHDSTESLNNASLVIKLVYGSIEWLLVGDAEKSVEAKLLRRYLPMVSGEMLKVGHHGSSTSSSREFVRTAAPCVAVISSGKNNRFGHPSHEVLTILRQEGIELHRTDREGAVILESDGRMVSVVDWRVE